jgi:hypothetical protein
MPSSPKKQTLVIGDDNANVETTPSINFDNFRIRACMQCSVQGEPNKKLKRKKRRLFPSSFTITDAISNITHVEKEIEF